MYQFRLFYSLVFILLFFITTSSYAGLGFNPSSYIVQEDGNTITVSVELSGIDGTSDVSAALPISYVSVDYTVSGGTATLGSDYGPLLGTGTLEWFADGIEIFDIPITADSLTEGNETIVLSLSNCQQEGESTGSCSSLVVTQATAIVTIVDNPPGVIAFSNSSYTVTEAGQVAVSVTRSGGSYGAVSVNYATSNGTAVAGQDYTATSGALSWADGDAASKTILLNTTADLVNEENENFLLALNSPTGGSTLGALSTASITLLNQSTPGEINLSSSNYTVAEGGQVTVSVNRSNGSSGAVSVSYATVDGTAFAGQDYTAVSGTLNWAAGDSAAKTFVISALTDAVIENNEILNLSLLSIVGSAQLGSQSTATITIGNTAFSLEDVTNLTEEQQVTAKAIDDLCANPTGDLVASCNAIYNSGLTNQQLIEVIETVTPSQISAQGNIAIDFGFQQLKVIHGRIATLRGNQGSKNRISLAGLSVSLSGQNIPLGKFIEGFLTQALIDESADEPFRDSRLGFFVKGQVNLGNKDSSSNEIGFDLSSKSITLGLDYQFTDQFLAGISAGYGYSNIDYERGTGEMEAHLGSFSLYGSYYLPQEFYIDWVLSYSINAYDSERNISFTGFQGVANSSPLGSQYGGSFGFGKDFSVKNIFLSPYVRLEYLYTEIDDYNESGGGGFALHLDEQSIYSVATTLGGQVSQSISMPWGIITPGARFEWLHQFEDDERTINTRFISGGSFSVSTDAPDRDYFNLAASLAITLPEGRSAFLRYESRLGQTDIISHTIEASVRIPF